MTHLMWKTNFVFAKKERLKPVCYIGLTLNGWKHRFSDLSSFSVLSACLFEPRCEKTGLRGFRPGPTHTRLYNYTRWLETRNFISIYLCSENKGADQLRSYSEADLRLCFRICKKKRFSHNAAHILAVAGPNKQHSCRVSHLPNH